MRASSSGPPEASTYHETKEINGVLTDVAIFNFSDRIFLVISQNARFGTVISAKADDSVARPGAAPSFDVSVLLGRRDDPLLLIYARQLVETVSRSSSRPLLLSISLRERDPSTFEQVAAWVRPLL
ncbi:hypothetical protein NSK_008436 [Nannochloropsis salina CCMP1776]|uniref:Uncharacterized protein n=1 Tax=Nannochloropsis salina CCMP1776 TaxID=1027361 RepID=A0A4D9CRY9_9STRA|nr:hypothetical protein NSK_008436 [Nannochloropsis salina CCMP1776]|eukprot:TFJ80293.1 hypothetical protein NSK_008436 [Nannochloropsis salina CCMP1776]